MKTLVGYTRRYLLSREIGGTTLSSIGISSITWMNSIFKKVCGADMRREGDFRNGRMVMVLLPKTSQKGGSLLVDW